jgi:hypothetical protein
LLPAACCLLPVATTFCNYCCTTLLPSAAPTAAAIAAAAAADDDVAAAAIATATHRNHCHNDRSVMPATSQTTSPALCLPDRNEIAVLRADLHAVDPPASFPRGLLCLDDRELWQCLLLLLLLLPLLLHQPGLPSLELFWRVCAVGDPSAAASAAAAAAVMPCGGGC